MFFLNQVTGSLWAADGCYDPDIAAMNGGEKNIKATLWLSIVTSQPVNQLMCWSICVSKGDCLS